MPATSPPPPPSSSPAGRPAMPGKGRQGSFPSPGSEHKNPACTMKNTPQGNGRSALSP